MLRAPRFWIAAAAVLAGLAVTAGVLVGGQGGGRRGGMRGAEDIGRYFASHVERLIAATVVFDDVTAADGEYYLRWRMTVAARGLADGRPVSTIGMSHLRFDAEGRVLFHQDYWDSTRGLFEHVPVVGWAIRRIKSRF